MFSYVASSHYQAISVTMDILTLCLAVTLLLCVWGEKGCRNKKLAKSMLLSVGALISMCLSNIGSILCCGNAEVRTLFILFTYIDVFFSYLFFILKFNLILQFVPAKTHVEKVLRHAVFTVYTTVFTVAVIPLLFHYIWYIPEGTATLVKGPLADVFYLVMLIGLLLDNVYQIMQHKIIGIKYTMVLVFVQLLPAAFFLLFALEEPPVIFVSTLSLLIYFIIVYQRLLYESRENLLKEQNVLTEKKASLADMKTKLILSKVEPHFIYNTLTTIAYLCKTNPKDAEAMTLKFASYLRRNVDDINIEEPVEFRKELSHIETYLAIEQIRFKERLQVEYDIGEDAFLIPILTVQPIVENSVKHGACKLEKGGYVKISTYSDDDNYYVAVYNNGPIFDPNATAKDGKSHVGFQNTLERITQFGGRLEILNGETFGTTVRITIPRDVG